MRSLFHISLLLLPFRVASQEISISIFNSSPVKGLVIAMYDGIYDLYSENERILGFNEGKNFYISLFNKKLLLNGAEGPVGCYETLSVKSQNPDSRIQVTILEPKSGTRTYSGNLHLKIDYGRIIILNQVETEKYIAGVVEAEAGIRAMPEFYKAQALLCRTYLYSHLNRHQSEGFHLCDEVHCQAYKGFTPFTASIFKSTSETSGKIIRDTQGNYITASFHANCGGETESAQNTWIRSETYLAPVKDPYCKHSSSANWEKKIPLDEWKKYLKDHGFKTQSLPASAYEMRKPGRQLHYKIGKETLLTRQIRSDWNLRSSYFQVLVKGNLIILKGHGYGHGVGLCQDGAMVMATQGSDYSRIIQFYFKGVRIEDIQ